MSHTSCSSELRARSDAPTSFPDGASPAGCGDVRAAALGGCCTAQEGGPAVAWLFFKKGRCCPDAHLTPACMPPDQPSSPVSLQLARLDTCVTVVDAAALQANMASIETVAVRFNTGREGGGAWCWVALGPGTVPFGRCAACRRGDACAGPQGRCALGGSRLVGLVHWGSGGAALRCLARSGTALNVCQLPTPTLIACARPPWQDREGADAAGGERNIADLLLDQIEFADVILLNKTDLVPTKGGWVGGACVGRRRLPAGGRTGGHHSGEWEARLGLVGGTCAWQLRASWLSLVSRPLVAPTDPTPHHTTHPPTHPTLPLGSTEALRLAAFLRRLNPSARVLPTTNSQAGRGCHWGDLSELAGWPRCRPRPLCLHGRLWQLDAGRWQARLPPVARPSCAPRSPMPPRARP